MLATVGGSPTRASEVALLAVEGTKELLSSQPSHWQTLRKSSKVEVHPVHGNLEIMMRLIASLYIVCAGVIHQHDC